MSAASLLEIRPAGGFGMIMADPPWSYEMRSEAGYAKAPEAQYRTLPLADIMALPVEALAAPDCLLWLWAVNPQLPQAIDVLRAWGFTFKTAGTWVKRTIHGKVNFGTGYILRSANEPFLIGTRGKPRTTRATRSAVVTHGGLPEGLRDDHWPSGTFTIEDLARQHSRKPDAAYAACEALMPNAQRADLFSRTDRKGWRAWGDQAGSIANATS